ncbi:hypothetical protein C7H09_07985 [Marinobacter fuscus]|uniref:Uncharacterized protein n=1 Tax=Marinobacter fuscus TaxID=2109942 RepID=A0A2T1KGK7_9GAMM|nr:hypothetical protein [Marinobacter fuscus]PSF09249.1 hypothetical protein C7H09_07985 [Marinobacter fuscus]
MKFILGMTLLLFTAPGFVLAKSSFQILDAQGVSRLDLAMVRLKQDAFEFQVQEKMNGSGAFELRYVGVRYDNETQKLKLYASVKAEPTEFYCRLALKNFMNHFNFGGDAASAAKTFYSFYFMPTASAPLSYEIQLYESVYRNTEFEMTVVDAESNAKIQCRYSGSSQEIRYSEM